MLKKTLIAVFILFVSFASIAMAASTSSYSGEFKNIITQTVGSVDITTGELYVSHTQSNVKDRSVTIYSLKKGIFGYGSKSFVTKQYSDGSLRHGSLDMANGTYKLRFEETTDRCSTCGFIKISGKFSQYPISK